VLIYISEETHGQQPTQSIKVPQLSEEEGPHIETKTGTFRQRKVTRFGPRLDIAPIPSLPSFLWGISLYWYEYLRPPGL
jgi:hypothetical protein